VGASDGCAFFPDDVGLIFKETVIYKKGLMEDTSLILITKITESLYSN